LIQAGARVISQSPRPGGRIGDARSYASSRAIPNRTEPQLAGELLEAPPPFSSSGEWSPSPSEHGEVLRRSRPVRPLWQTLKSDRRAGIQFQVGGMVVEAEVGAGVELHA